MTRISGRFWLGFAGLLLAACGGNDGGPGGTSGSKVTLDSRSAVHDSVTVAGKVLTATSHGVTYTLTIPAGAVQLPTVITMTPVTGIDTLGTIQLIGAVDLQPSGLVLGKAATLRIAVAHTAPAGTALLGFGYEGDAETLSLLLPTDSAGGINLSIRHFSGGGAAFATLGQIQTFAPRTPVTTEDGFYTDSLFALTLLDPRDFLAEQNVMRAWFAAVVLPALQNAGNDVSLLAAMSRFDFWRAVQTPANLIPDDPLFANERDQFAQAALAKLQQAVVQNNAACLADRDLSFANNVLFWQTVAGDLGLASVPNGLDRAGVLAGLCLHVLITDSSYPDPVLPQATGTLDLLAGVQYGSQPALDPGLFAWRLDITGSTADGAVQSLSAPDGSFTHVISPTGQGSLVVAISACLNAPEVPYADICAVGNLVRNFGGCGRVLEGNFDIDEPGDLTLMADVRRVTGTLSISGGVGVVDLPCLQRVDGSLMIQSGLLPWTSPGIAHFAALDSILGNLQVQQTQGFQDLQVPGLRLVQGDIGIFANPDLHAVILPDLTVRDVNLGNGPLQSITLGQIEVRNLQITNTDQLTDIDIGGMTGQSLALILVSNTVLNHLSLGSFATGGIILRGNSALADLGGIPGSAQVRGFAFDLGNGFSEQAALDFANRVQVTTSVCQDDVSTGARIKCYAGPPWH